MGRGSARDPDARAELQARVERIDAWLEWPMAVLGLVWLAALVAEFLTHVPRWVEDLILVIWGVFLVELVVRFAVAPDKLRFLRQNWISLVALVLPAARALRGLRALQALRLARVVAAIGHMRSDLASLMREHGLRYVLLLTLVVTFVGAAAMYGAEHTTNDSGFRSYTDALWWTAMLITTIGSQYWPHTAEGRVVALLLSGYALGVLGYITAALSAFLIGRDTRRPKAEAERARSLDALRDEIARLAHQVERLGDARPPPAPRDGEQAPRESGERAR